ncbi:MAG TPA: glycosyltransferase family 4 protein [Candidatus Acetothermia bacterium]|nr:glycosyltransferase family 4 protein [Candidatus Acetothermia bacterium]
MHIGLFSDAYLPEISGVTTTVHWLKEELENLGHVVYVYAPHYEGIKEDEAGIFRFHSGRFAFHKASRVALPYSRAATRSFKELDILHSHTPFSMGLVAVGAATRYHLPHVHTYHTHLMEDRKYLPRALRPRERETGKIIAAFCNRCTLITAPSTAFKEELLGYGVHRPIRVFPFGVKLSLFRQPPIWDPRVELNIPQKAKMFLYAGRLAMEKNLPFLIRAYAQIHAQDPTSVLVLAGDGPLRERTQEEVKEMGIGDAVRFTGFLDHPRLVDLYKAADLFLFASKTETQGLVLVEAMAAGTPAVAIGALGVLDVVQDGVNGILVPEDKDTFVEAALALANDEERRSLLQRGALATAEELSTRNSTLRLLEVFEECLNGLPE